MSPDLRSKIESWVDKIAKGENKIDQIVDQAINIFKEKYVTFKAKIDLMDENFHSFFGSV